jgi:hypothetical protein
MLVTGETGPGVLTRHTFVKKMIQCIPAVWFPPGRQL